MRRHVELARFRVGHRRGGNICAARAAGAVHCGEFASVIARVNRRVKQRTHLIVGHGVDRLLSDLRCEVSQVVFSNALHIEWRRLGYVRLRGRQHLARHDRRRHGLVDDWPQRLTGDAIEGVDPSLLSHLRDRWHFAAARHVEVEQHGRRGIIEVPDLVLDHLEMPFALAGASV